MLTGLIWQGPTQTPAAIGPAAPEQLAGILDKLKPRGTLPNCEAARQAAAVAGNAWLTLDTQAQKLHLELPANIDQAERQVENLENIAQASRDAADTTIGAAALLSDVDDAIDNAAMIGDEAARLIDLAREKNSLEILDLARQYNEASQIMTRAAAAALDQWQATFDTFHLATRSISALFARTRAGIEHVKAEGLRESYNAMVALAHQATSETDDALSRFARTAGGIVLFGLAAVVGLLVWRFARR